MTVLALILAATVAVLFETVPSYEKSGLKHASLLSDPHIFSCWLPVFLETGFVRSTVEISCTGGVV